MRWDTTVAAVLLAASRACSAAEIRALEVEARYQVTAVDVLERRYEDVANHYLSKRQAFTQANATGAPLNPDGSLNFTAWEVQVSAACTLALSKLQIASNPSGTCICYNIPTLDTTTGAFEADLRLFKISDPTGDFVGIPPQNIQVALSYQNASASPVQASSLNSRSLVLEPLWPMNDRRELIERDSSSLQLLQSYLFVGQIDSNSLTPSMTMAQFEALVMPVLTLTGVNATGGTVSTNVSSNEAAFVTGVFSQEVVMSDFALATANFDAVVAQLANGTVAFVLPGVQILIFPVGLIVTGAWLLIGVAAYGLGTYDRIRFAESFRRRKAMASGAKRT